MRLPQSIQGRLLALLLGAVALVWLAAAAVTWFDVRNELDELLDAHLAQAAALLVVQQSGEIEPNDDRTVEAPALHRYAPRAVFQVFHEGQLVLRSADAPLLPLMGTGAAATPGFTTVTANGIAWRVFSTRGSESDVQVFVGERLDAREHIVRAALWGTLWPLALALPLLALLAWWAIRRGLQPLRSLGAQLAARTVNTLQPVVVAAPPVEVAPLVQALNSLFSRIEGMLQSERRFTADAAHELRTPIAAIRAQAQVALAEADVARRQHALRATLEGCDRAARMVDQLLTLSRLEAGAEVPIAAVDLNALARQVVGDLAPKALHKQQDLGLDTSGVCMIDGNEVLLGLMLRNLVDNAVRYCPVGARINVGTAMQTRQAVLVVEDSGPGLSEQEIARLGQRFVRGSGHEESGSGLGWSIVRRIAQVHGLAVEVTRSVRLGGLAVTIAAHAAAGEEGSGLP
jgi:two-component system, OmpR family, sensor histidine kinase QseC